MRLHVTDKVRARIIDGRVVLLVIDEGDYVILDAVATVMWEAITTVDEHARTDFVASRVNASAAQIIADIAAFQQSCVERGFLAVLPSGTTVSSAQSEAGKHPTAISAWLMMLRTGHALKAGFGPVYRYCLALPKPVNDPEPSRLAAAARAFLRAENLFIYRNAPRDCLPRSLALYWFLTKYGVRANHCIGVSRYPFEAHAWVESGGAVLLDRPEWVATHVELARI